MPDNIIPVSTEYKNDSKSLERIFEHEITIENLTTGQDITEYVDIQSFKIDVKKTALTGLISANTLIFDIELNIDTDISTIISKGDKIQMYDEYTPEGPVLTAGVFGLGTHYQDTNLPEEGFPPFTGYVQSIPERYANLEHRFAIKVYDRIKDGIKAKFEEHIVKTGWYLCNNNVPEQSLAHYCAYQMGFTDADIIFEDIRLPYSSELSGSDTDVVGQDTDIIGSDTDDASLFLSTVFNTDPSYVIIPYAHFEKGNKVMAELRGMVESVQGNVFMNNADKLMLFSPVNEEDYDYIDYTMDDNIVGTISKETQYAKYDRVQVNYDTFNVAERQECWRFYDKNSYDAANDLANMLIRADAESGWYKVEWVTPIALNLESETPEILVEDSAGNDMSAYFNYEIDVDQTGGKIRFHNLSADADIYIQRFKIYGQPLEKYSGNETSYTESDNPDKTLPIENKWIQSAEHAEMNAKYAFHLNCKDRDVYRFRCYYAPFLAINNLVTVNKRQIVNKQSIVTEFVHQPEDNILYTNVVLEEFLPYEGFLGTLDTLEATPNLASDRLDFEQERLEENGVYSEGLPVPQPQNIIAQGSFKHIWVEWNEVLRSDLQGYNIYVTDITDVSNPVVKKYWADTNGYSFEAQNGHDFEIEVSTKCIAGESEKAGIVTASTLLLKTADYQDLSIVNAKIADLAVDNAKIADLNAGKIIAGILESQNGLVYFDLDNNEIVLSNQDGDISLLNESGLAFYKAGYSTPHWYSKRAAYGIAQDGDYIDLASETGVPWDSSPKVQTAIRSLTTFSASATGDQQYQSYPSGVSENGFYVYGHSVVPSQIGTMTSFSATDVSSGNFYSGWSRSNATKISYSFSGTCWDSTSWNNYAEMKFYVYYQVYGGSWVLYKHYSDWTGGGGGTVSGLPSGQYRFRIYIYDTRRKAVGKSGTDKSGDIQYYDSSIDVINGDFNDWAEETIDNGEVLWIAIEGGA